MGSCQSAAPPFTQAARPPLKPPEINPICEITGYRQYPKEALERLHLIKRAQELGFSLKEISQLLAPCDNALESRAMAEEKLFVVRYKITRLVAVRAVLKKLIHQCDANPDATGSSMISALSGVNNPP